MEKVKKLFNINISWKALIIFAIISGVYTGVVAILPIVNDTSFSDISMTFEWWVLFGIIIIMSSKSAKESALKCFVFFLISQPLVYLTQAPFHVEGFGVFKYYPGWFVWTLFTIPMGYIGYQLKQDKWWGLFILTPVLLFLGFHYEGFLSTALSFFPRHLLSALFCVITMLIYPICIFKNKNLKLTGVIISVIILIIMTFAACGNEKDFYNTTVMHSGSYGMEFDDKYNVYLEDEEYGKVYISYDSETETYVVNAEFIKEGKTELIIESPEGEKKIFDLTVKRYSYDLKENTQEPLNP